MRTGDTSGTALLFGSEATAFYQRQKRGWGWDDDTGCASNGFDHGYTGRTFPMFPMDAMGYELPKEEQPKLPKYDPGGARQMWQPGYPRIRLRGDKHPAHMPRYNQVQHTARPLNGRRGRK